MNKSISNKFGYIVYVQIKKGTKFINPRIIYHLVRIYINLQIIIDKSHLNFSDIITVLREFQII